MRLTLNWCQGASDLAIDIGTSKIAIFTKDEGVELEQPSLLCIRTAKSGAQKVLAFGSQAKDFLGREPLGVETIKPIRGGVIEHLSATRLILQAMMAEGRFTSRMAKPRIVVAAPHGISTIERNAFIEAARSLNAKSVHVVCEPVASALGAGLDICGNKANMIVDIGSGITEIMVFSSGDMVCSESIRVGGDDITAAVILHLRKYHDLLVGEMTADLLKPLIPGSMFANCLTDSDCFSNSTILVKGVDAVSRLPCQREVSGFELSQAMEKPVCRILETIKKVVERVPPELLSDLCERGMVLAGGGAQLQSIDRLIYRETGLPVRLADKPRGTVLQGARYLLQDAVTFAKISRGSDLIV